MEAGECFQWIDPNRPYLALIGPTSPSWGPRPFGGIIMDQALASLSEVSCSDQATLRKSQWFNFLGFMLARQPWTRVVGSLLLLLEEVSGLCWEGAGFRHAILNSSSNSLRTCQLFVQSTAALGLMAAVWSPNIYRYHGLILRI